MKKLWKKTTDENEEIEELTPEERKERRLSKLKSVGKTLGAMAAGAMLTLGAAVFVGSRNSTGEESDDPDVTVDLDVTVSDEDTPSEEE